MSLKKFSVFMLAAIMAGTVVFSATACAEKPPITDGTDHETGGIVDLNNTVTDLNGNTLAIYEHTKARMSSLNYRMRGDGTSKLSPMGGPLVIYSTLDHTPTALYLDNISSGEPILGAINVSFGARAYVNTATNTYRIGKCEGKENTDQAIATNGGDWGTVGDGADMAADAFMKIYFGRPTDQLFSYPITATSTTATNYQKLDDDTFQLAYTLNTSDNTVTNGYRKQVNTISGQEVKKVLHATVTMIIDKNFKIKSANVQEKYEVMLLSATTTNKIDYSYTYPETLNVRSF